jgi:copper chaperone CopZ
MKFVIVEITGQDVLSLRTSILPSLQEGWTLREAGIILSGEQTYPFMKNHIALLGISVALCLSAHAAETTAKISGVHLCCKSCVTGVEKATSSVPNAKAEIDAEASTVTITGPDVTTVKKAAAALTKAGYYGKSSNPMVVMDTHTGAKNAKMQSLKIEGVHLCCGKCVKAVDKAVKSVDGVKEQTATKGAKSFEVTGDFNDKDVFDALHKEGLTGRVAKE